jgi:hypothetical protein
VQRVAAIISFLAIFASAHADDAYWSAVGSPGNFGKSKDIRMVSERVDITLHASYMHVRATFNFSKSGGAEKVTTAFPELMVDYTKRDADAPISISKFRCWVDGKPVPVARKSMPLPQVSEYSNYSAVWLKEISFPADGKRQVVCEYDSRCSLERQYVDAYYVLRTGATWKGSIGDCLIHVDWAPLKGMGRPEFRAAQEPIGGGPRLRATVRGKTWAEFHFKNLKPTFDLEMLWPSGFWNYMINGKEPQAIPLRREGETQMHGTQDDPALDFIAFSNLLGIHQEVARIDRLYEKSSDDRTIKRLRLREHLVDFVEPGVIKLDGKPFQVRKVPGYSMNGVYVRDMVKALGGTFQYHPELERADIAIRW